jgi:ABC-2 type transport system permease protein
VPFYGVTLLVGIVSWQFLAEATSQSVRSLVARENLVRKVDFPRLAVPLATVLTALFNYVLALVPVMVFLLAAGGGITWRFVELPFLVVLLFVLAFALALSLSALFVRYRDVEPIWDVVMQAGFYVSVIIIPIEVVIQKFGADHPWIPRAALCNPFAAILQQMRHAVVSPAQQSTTQALSWYVLIPIGILLVLLAVGYTIFSRAAPKIAEDL